MTKRKTNHIPLRHYKVLLVQIARELISRVEDTGLSSTSKRSHLAVEVDDLLSQLEREFKRDVTLKSSAEEKKALFMELFEGGLPSWFLHSIYNSLTEESRKLKRVEA